MHTEFHDRMGDGEYGYNDEMIFCIQPLAYQHAEMPLKFGIKADALLIDSDTKILC